MTGVKHWKKWSKWLAFITCYLCHFIYVNQNQTRVIEREILSFWTRESNAEKFSARRQICKRKDPGCQNTFSYRCFAHSCDCWDYRIYKRKHYEDLNTNTVNSLYSGHCRDLELVSSLARVRNSGSSFQSNACNLFLPGM